MTTFLYTHKDFGHHETPPGHPEQQPRYAYVKDALAGPAFGFLERREAPEVAWDRIALAHPEPFSQIVREAAPSDETVIQLDPDTWMGRHSLSASRRAAGAGVAAVDEIMACRADNAFVAARPPGHHAEQDRAMGFCVFNSAAIAALHAQEAHGCTRVAVVDFDVHHGNGTQAIFWGRENAFFASSHQWPHYPGTGAEADRGLHDQIRNATLQNGEGGDEFRRSWGEILLPALSDFDPDFIVISAGFDAHAADPLGGLNLVEDDFLWVTEEIKAVAAAQCQGRIVSFLEGGYDLEALAKSAAAHVKALAS
ncbi:MAG: histone deacetylase family protein [Aquisalinus sp.]|nr:histone deacetylase family protein [Aquisalinus sp.]